jgi:hypothetical protein
MRNTMIAGALAALVLGWAAQAAMAQKDGDRPARNRGDQPAARQRGDRPAAGDERLMNILTEDQRAEAREIMQDARREAASAETPERKREIMQKARQRLRALLTEEQRKDLRGRAGRRGVELTPEQQEHVRQIFRDALAKAEGAKEPGGRIAAYKQAQKEMLSVLNADQKAAFERLHRQPAGLELTAQQRNEIEAIRQTARLASELGQNSREKLAIAREARERALGVLTDEQRAQLRQMRARREQRRERPGPEGRAERREGRRGEGPAAKRGPRPGGAGKMPPMVGKPGMGGMPGMMMKGAGPMMGGRGKEAAPARQGRQRPGQGDEDVNFLLGDGPLD